MMIITISVPIPIYMRGSFYTESTDEEQPRS
jgi:hypothetical protein